MFGVLCYLGKEFIVLRTTFLKNGDSTVDKYAFYSYSILIIAKHPETLLKSLLFHYYCESLYCDLRATFVACKTKKKLNIGES